MKIQVCTGKTCQSKFSKYITKRIKNDIEKFNLKNIEIQECSCMGLCDKAINVKIDNQVIHNANPIKISNIVCAKK